MDFENIVISPPDNDRFLNFIRIVINLYTWREENLKIVWRSPLSREKREHCACISGGWGGGGGGGAPHPRESPSEI